MSFIKASNVNEFLAVDSSGDAPNSWHQYARVNYSGIPDWFIVVGDRISMSLNPNGTELDIAVGPAGGPVRFSCTAQLDTNPASKYHGFLVYNKLFFWVFKLTDDTNPTTGKRIMIDEAWNNGSTTTVISGPGYTTIHINHSAAADSGEGHIPSSGTSDDDGGTNSHP